MSLNIGERINLMDNDNDDKSIDFEGIIADDNDERLNTIIELYRYLENTE